MESIFFSTAFVNLLPLHRRVKSSRIYAVESFLPHRLYKFICQRTRGCRTPPQLKSNVNCALSSGECNASTRGKSSWPPPTCSFLLSHTGVLAVSRAPTQARPRLSPHRNGGQKRRLVACVWGSCRIHAAAWAIGGWTRRIRNARGQSTARHTTSSGADQHSASPHPRVRPAVCVYLDRCLVR